MEPALSQGNHLRGHGLTLQLRQHTVRHMHMLQRISSTPSHIHAYNCRGVPVHQDCSRSRRDGVPSDSEELRYREPFPPITVSGKFKARYSSF